MNKLMFKLCTVLLLHRGPLQELSLSLPILRSFPAQIDQILLFIQEKCSIKSLTITVESRYWRRIFPFRKNYKGYKLPKRLFSFSQLKVLRLCCCQFTSYPVSFECFSMLTVLELRNVIFEGCGKVWSFTCPLLSALTLVQCGRGGLFKLPRIVIEAPKLCRFHFHGTFSSLQLNNTPFLKTAILHKEFTFSLDRKIKDNPSDFLKFWGGLAAVESLSVSGYLYQYLRIGNSQAIDLSPLPMLRHMKLDRVCLNSKSIACSVLLMIKRSPNLQQIAISDGNNVSKHELSRLTRVEVKRLKGIKHETAFLEWLLSSSPALESMEIQLEEKLSAAEKVLILTELNGFQRASTRARIIVE
ncbi:unnamed protein product [Linum tenue]|uniref:F-box/LRR-repeat protein 15/At3g58940/PEG3-like LRR domain-containing protein n=1 Tax=Linum tenue TaxID=586396 RepID=A0AAV0QH26_9ROSI|nr:unnamed protein product [Linum tenue]